MKRVRETIVAVQKQEILHILSVCARVLVCVSVCVCVCNLSYPACKAHAPHFHLWPV